MKPKPPCPVCTSTQWVKTIAGGSKGVYRYVCYAHPKSVEWQQIPPHKQVSNESLRLKMKDTGVQRARRDYRCGLCGQIKKGHVCTGPKRPSTSAEDRDADASDVCADREDSDSDDELHLPPLPAVLLLAMPVPLLSNAAVSGARLSSFGASSSM